MTTATQTIQKGYKQTDIGVIPADWDALEVKDFTYSVASGKSKTASESGDYPIYGSTGIIGYRKRPDYSGDKVLIARVGANAGTVNMASGEYCVSDNTLMVTYKPNVDIIFSYYQLVNFNLNKLIFGSGQPLVTGGQVKKVIFPVPHDKKEQTAIAAVLSSVDSLIVKLETLIEKKKNIKHGAMQELLTGKRRLPGFSGTWDMITYNEAFDFLSTAQYSRDQLGEGKTRYIHYGDIHTKWNCFVDLNKDLPSMEDEKVDGHSLVLDGDLIMADASEDYGGIGKSVEVKNEKSVLAISGLHTFLLRDRGNYFVKGFKGYIHLNKMVKASMDRLATGLKVYGVSKANLKLIQIPRPPLQEQVAIATVLSDMDAEIEKLESQLSKYQNIKQGMMQTLLIGKIRLI